MKRISKKIGAIALSTLMLTSHAADHNYSYRPNEKVDSGMVGYIKIALGSIKQRIQKLCDCIMGNDETCTPNEIIVVRAVVMLAIGTLYRVKWTHAERQRITERREVFANRMANPDQISSLLAQIREQSTGEISQWPNMRQVIEASFQEAQDRFLNTEHRDEVDLNDLNTQRATFLNNHAFEQEGEGTCCVCLEERDDCSRLDFIPCHNAHNNTLCLSCLGEVVANDQPCPICRKPLFNQK